MAKINEHTIRTMRIENADWSKIEAIAMAMSHEFQVSISQSDVMRIAIKDLIKKWEG